MRLLLCTDGSAYAERAARFGALIGRAAQAEGVLLGIAESARFRPRVEASLAQLRSLVGDALPGLTVKIRQGHAAEQILEESEAADYDLIVIGSRGRRGLTRFLLGSTAATLAKYARTPLLIVKGDRPALRRILLCTGGEAVAEANARLGGRIAAVTGAEVTVLHVMSQLPLAPEADTAQLGISAEEAIGAGTREGLHLQRSLTLLREAGTTGEVRPKIRHGLVVDEILGEVGAGDYDLLVIGAHQAPGEAAWGELRELLLDDVADQLISHCPRPVLVVRG